MRQTMTQRARPPSREDYFIRRPSLNLPGRLGLSGPRPRLMGCTVLEFSNSGAVVEVFAPMDETAKFFTLEFNGQYHRARLVRAEGEKLLLAFFAEELDYIEPV